MSILSTIQARNGKHFSQSELKVFINTLEPGNNELKTQLQKALAAMVAEKMPVAKIDIAPRFFMSLDNTDCPDLAGLIEEYTPAEIKALGITDAGLSGTSFAGVARALIERIKEGGLFWQKPWAAGEAMNYESKRPYKGIVNQLVTYGYGNGLFLTKKQIDNMGGTLKKDAKRFLIYYMAPFKIKEKVDGKGKERLGFVAREYTVYESKDISGIDFKVVKRNNPEIIEAERLVKGYKGRPEINHGGDKAFYSPARDIVQMPPKNRFDSSAAYYCTLFHELVHSTGSNNRLKREKGLKFGDKRYAREEFVAELGANFLCSRADIPFATVQSAAYLKGWARDIISEDKKTAGKFLLKVMQDALRATNLIIGDTKPGKPKAEVKTKTTVRPAVKSKKTVADQVKKKTTISRSITKPKARKAKPAKRKITVYDYEALLHDLARHESLLEIYQMGWDDDMDKIVYDNVVKISSQSARKETGAKIGANKDINPSKVSNTSKVSVERAAELIWEDLSEEKQSTTSVQEIRDIIIEYLLVPYKTTPYQRKLEAKIKEIKGKLASVSAPAQKALAGDYAVSYAKIKKKIKAELLRKAKKGLHGASDILPVKSESNPVADPVQLPSPVPARGKKFTGAEISRKNYRTLEFEGPWLEAIGKPSENFNTMVWGLPKNGKTHFSMQLAKYLSRFGKVLYNASDEGESQTLQAKILQYHLDRNDFVVFADIKTAAELEHDLSSGEFKYVFIDLVSTTEGLTPELMREWKAKYPNVGFILVFSSTKEGNFKGDNSWAHFFDVLADVKAGVATVTGRFGGGEFHIFNDSE